MDIIFREKYVNYDEFDDVELVNINDVLIKDDIYIELGDKSSNDWAGYSYYHCKEMGEFDDITISSFVYIITWFMTGNAVEINPNFKSSYYYKNDEIINHCLDIYNHLNDRHEYESEVDFCEELFINIYDFYLNFQDMFIKKSERMNCLLTYKDMELFDKVEGKSRSDKLGILLDTYYK